MLDTVHNLAPAPKPVASLAAAVRLARVEGAERSQVIAELRGAEMARLEMLRDAIAPLLAEVPEGIDLFDAALMGGEHPRLFLDMIGFFEMGRDRRTYRFVQDTRHGRVVIAEGERLEPMADAARHYVARRLVEREKALASDQTVERAARAYATKGERLPRALPQAAPRAEAPRPRRRRPVSGGLFRIARFAIEFLGAFTLGIFLMALALFAYAPLRAWLGAQLGWPA